MNIYIGTSGYTYSGWIGKFYPKKLNPKKMFEHYCKHFNTVEINYTFYHTPKESTIKKWHDISQDDFTYTLKLSRFITHIKRLNNCKEPLKNFNKLSRLFKKKCGMILIQMPPSFHLNDENISRIKNSFKYLDKKLNYAIEFRHNSWFSSTEAEKICRKFNVSFCIVSAPGIPFYPVVTSSNVYIRMHGKNKWYDYNYSKKELLKIAEIIKNYLKKKLNVWVYFNNDYHSYAPYNALKLKEIIKNE